jgi:type II secretory pathway pseudopilin PulG
MKGVSEVATLTLYAAITVGAVGGVLNVAVPALQEQSEAAQVRNAQDFMRSLESAVEEVASRGEGSRRTLSLSFSQGSIESSSVNDTISYSLETGAEVISPQVSTRTGDIVLSSNAGVSVRNQTCEGVQSYVLENEHIKSCIRNIGDDSNPQDINTSGLLVKHEFKDRERDLNANMSVLVNSNTRTTSGQGFTTTTYDTLPRSRVGTGQVTATIQSPPVTYDIVFQLPTGADFLKVDVQNFR